MMLLICSIACPLVRLSKSLSNLDFSVRAVTWQEAHIELSAIRTVVFIVEQNVPVELEWDGLDEACLHVLAIDGQGNAIGVGRLLYDGHIGRMAVIKPYRNQGVGSALLRRLLEMAEQHKLRQLALNAQVHAQQFYSRFGFEVVGGVFDDAGIPHVKMVRCLSF